MDAKPSYTATPNNRSYDYKTYGDHVSHWAATSPHKEAFVGYNPDGSCAALTCLELKQKAVHFGKYLLSIGFKKGDSVLFCMGNSTNSMIAFFGIAFAGGICVNLAPRSKNGSDVIETVKQNSISIIVTDLNDGNVESVKNYVKSKADLGLIKIIYNLLEETDLEEYKDFAVNFADILTIENDFSDLDLPNICPEDMLYYYQSSGSTGVPKLIGHSHVTYHNSTFGINDVMHIDQSSTFYCDRPLSWGVGSPRTFIAAGSTRVFANTAWAMDESNVGTHQLFYVDMHRGGMVEQHIWVLRA